jgi:hypothetical protein
MNSDKSTNITNTDQSGESDETLSSSTPFSPTEVKSPEEQADVSAKIAAILPTVDKDNVSPMATAIGGIAAQPEVDAPTDVTTSAAKKPNLDLSSLKPEEAAILTGTAVPQLNSAAAATEQPTTAQPSPMTPPAPPEPTQTSTPAPDVAQRPAATTKTVKLPVATTLVPAFLIGALILLLFLAVVLYAFVI